MLLRKTEKMSKTGLDKDRETRARMVLRKTERKSKNGLEKGREREKERVV